MFSLFIICFICPVAFIMLMYFISLFIVEGYRPYRFKYSVYKSMIDLLNWYKYGIPLPYGGCPLCKSLNDNCDKCPWVFIEGYRCYKFMDGISSLRHCPNKYPDKVQLRINMLERWISLSRRSLF